MTEASWKEDRLVIGWRDEVVIPAGWNFADRNFEVEVTDRVKGKHRRNVYMERPTFYGGFGIKLIDCHLATILDATFEDLRPLEERDSTAIKMVSRNKANMYRIVRPTITGYRRAGHFLGDMEAGVIDSPLVIGGYRGFVHEYKWGAIPVCPGPIYRDGHINVAEVAIAARNHRQMTIFRTNIHENLVYPLDVWETPNNPEDNVFLPILSVGGDGGMEGDFNWPLRWKAKVGK